MNINLKRKYKNNFDVENKKILEAKKKIKEEKEKIRKEKRNIRKAKIKKFKNTKIGVFCDRLISFCSVERDLYTFSEMLVVTLFSLVVGALACFSVFMIISGGRNYFKLSKELDKVVEVYETLIENYYGEVDKEELIDNAIDGMVSGVGDVYTNYVDTENTDEFDSLVGGIYEGIGCTIQLMENGVKILEVYKDSPAEKSGLIAGDIILKLDNKDATKMDADEIASYVKKASSEKINMVILRDKEEKELVLTRSKIEAPVVSSTIYEKNGKKIGYLSISIFTSVASKQFESKLKSLEKQGIDSLVMDVRGNSGGYLTTVKDISSMLLPKGKIIYQMEKDGEIEVTKDKTNEGCKYPIAVLTNGSSASASEILAAVIKESYGGYVVGTTTYGKGTVQQTKKLSDGSMIKYTVEKWLTPDGNWIDTVGIEPTHEVRLTEEYYNNPTIENDMQLQKALELVSE